MVVCHKFLSIIFFCVYWHKIFNFSKRVMFVALLYYFWFKVQFICFTKMSTIFCNNFGYYVFNSLVNPRNAPSIKVTFRASIQNPDTCVSYISLYFYILLDYSHNWILSHSVIFLFLPLILEKLNFYRRVLY